MRLCGLKVSLVARTIKSTWTKREIIILKKATQTFFVINKLNKQTSRHRLLYTQTKAIVSFSFWGVRCVCICGVERTHSKSDKNKQNWSLFSFSSSFQVSECTKKMRRRSTITTNNIENEGTSCATYMHAKFHPEMK